MNETIKITLLKDGQQVPIENLCDDGIVICGEVDASPRRVTVSLVPSDSFTRDRIRRLQILEDWRYGEFKLSCTRFDGSLVLHGHDGNPRGLPMGNYRLNLSIESLVTKHDPFIALDDGEQESVAVDILPDRRTVVVVPIGDFDQRVREVLVNPDSIIDGKPLPMWLGSPEPRAQRKACLLNVLTKLRTTPTVRAPLIDHVRNVFYADDDRIYAIVEQPFLAIIQALAKDPKQPFYEEGVPKAPIHKRLLNRAASINPKAASYGLASFRQEGRNSLQAVIATDSQGPSSPLYADLDIDLGNPLQDLQGLVIHCGEVLNPGKTDHLSLRAAFATGATADFLHYTVVKT